MYQDNNSTNLFLTQSSRRVLTTQWTRLEDKLFEQALVMFPEGISDRWQKIAERVPGKSSREVKEHYDMLLYDVYEIDAGRVEIPNYADDLLSCWNSNDEISFVSKSKQGENERKKSTPWTEEEHKLFLIGLKKFGKGDWRSISRNVVVTRTPTQVASHAQKYFLRQNSVKKERKRSSIHDITTVDGSTMDAPVDQNWVSLPGGSVQQVPALQQLPPGSHLPAQERLLEQMRSIGWGTLILQAYLNSVNLSANSDHVPNFSSMLYLNYGVAVSEVEVNLLTGETETLKTDYILCATAKLKSCCGFSQIEGAFVQGIGSLCLKNTPQSQRISAHGHKIPTVDTIPKQFNVEILNNGHRKKTCTLSKVSNITMSNGEQDKRSAWFLLLTVRASSSRTLTLLLLCIEGAYVQGIGFFMLEEYPTNSDGLVIANGTWTYKIPTVDTIHKQFNVEILNSGDIIKIVSSKGSKAAISNRPTSSQP